MKKGKIILITAMAIMAVTFIVSAAAYKAFSLPEPGEWRARGIGITQLKALHVDGAIPNNGTVIISRISTDGTATNQLTAATVTNGVATASISGSSYILDGDRLLRSGTVTNKCRVVLILE